MFLLSSLPLKLSLCFFLPSVALAAYLIHWSIESKDENGDDSTKSKQSFIEVRVPEECVGSIVGSQGSIVKDIQRKTNTRIGFRDRAPAEPHPSVFSKNGNNAKSPKADRLLVIRGSYLNVVRAEIEIRRLLLDSTSKLTQYFYVPSESCGRIIGRRGATIKEISSLSNCVIKLNDEPVDANDARIKKNTLIIEMADDAKSETARSSDNTDEDEFELVSNLKLKKIAITGSFEQIEHAKELITSKIKEEFQFKERAFSRRNNY